MQKETQPTNLIMPILAVKEGSVLISPAIAKKLVKQIDNPAPPAASPNQSGQTAWLDDLTKRVCHIFPLSIHADHS